MTEVILTAAEEVEIVKAVKEKNYEKTGKVFEILQGYIKAKYTLCNCGKYKITFDEFSSECHMVIIRGFSSFKGKSFKRLINYLKKTINKRTYSILKEYTDQRDKYILDKNNDKFFKNIETTETEQDHSELLSKLTLETYYNLYGYKSISNYEIDVLKTFIYSGDLREFANIKGIKYESVMKTLKRALTKIKILARSLGISQLKDSYQLYCH